jgi:hypothetical protein
MMRRDVRILLVGDGKPIAIQLTLSCTYIYFFLKKTIEGVGKSTLIASLIKETFIPNVRERERETRERDERGVEYEK